ncbi:unnamed protein product [Periconia digitata]|nr:unnamed protein product [Periconia digitata]
MVSADVGSSEELDIVDENLLRDKDSRAAGFVGKSSEMQWIRRLRQDAEHHRAIPLRGSGPYGPPGTDTESSSRRLEALRQRQRSNSNTRVPLSSSTFYVDDQGLEVDYTVHPFELPPMHVAQGLIKGYMDTVQDSFPILSRSSFMETVHELYASVEHGAFHSVPDKWLAVLNLVFAIGAQYSYLVEESWHIRGFNHLTYVSRAHILGLSTPDLVSHPDLMQVQITALLALYFLTTGRANRAWVYIGISVRYAHALGLHVRNEDRGTTVSQKENLVRIWWGLYTLEGNLSTTVGRPSFVIEDFCSAPLPLPLAMERMSDETLVSSMYAQYQGCTIHQSPTVATSEPSNAGSYLKSRARMGAITQQVVTGLYSARAIEMSWKQMQQKISGLHEQLETWLASLPSGLDFTQPTAYTTFQRERLVLNVHYIETKILITRPCMCRLDDRIKNQTEASDRFNKDTAKICVRAAEAMADLLPASVDVTYLYRTGPCYNYCCYPLSALTHFLPPCSSIGDATTYENSSKFITAVHVFRL